VNDTNGNSWVFNLCDQPTSCPPGSAVCVSTSDSIEDRGTLSSILLSDSPLGMNKGVEVTLGSQDANGILYKTLIEYICDDSMDSPSVAVRILDSTNTIITVNSSQACPQIVQNGPHVEIDSSSIPYPSGPNNMMRVGFLTILTGIMLTGCLCCLVQRRRTHRILAKNLSQVSFHPVPSSIQLPTYNTSWIPPYNPNIVPQQPLYYTPFVGQERPFQMGPARSYESDENIALELQAQYDRESIGMQ